MDPRNNNHFKDTTSPHYSRLLTAPSPCLCRQVAANHLPLLASLLPSPYRLHLHHDSHLILLQDPHLSPFAFFGSTTCITTTLLETWRGKVRHRSQLISAENHSTLSFQVGRLFFAPTHTPFPSTHSPLVTLYCSAARTHSTRHHHAARVR